MFLQKMSRPKIESNYEDVNPSTLACYRALFAFDPEAEESKYDDQYVLMEVDDVMEVKRPVNLQAGTEEHPEGSYLFPFYSTISPLDEFYSLYY